MSNIQLLKVLGIGSPFGDDRVGWAVVEMLQKKPELMPYIPEQLYLEKIDQPCISLLDSVRKTRTVILIDAIKSGSPLGTIHQYENPQFEDKFSLFSTHGMGINQVLQLGAILNNLPEEIFLYGIEIDQINYEEVISRSVYKAAESLAEIIALKILGLLMTYY